MHPCTACACGLHPLDLHECTRTWARSEAEHVLQTRLRATKHTQCRQMHDVGFLAQRSDSLSMRRVPWLFPHGSRADIRRMAPVLQAMESSSIFSHPEYVEYAATLCAAFFFLSPSVQMVQLFASRGAKLSAINPLTMLLMFFNCSLWVSWGVFLPMPPAVPGNLLGLVASVVYLAICWGFVGLGGVRTPSWGSRAAVGTATAVASSLLLMAYSAQSAEQAAHVGYLAMLICVAMFAAPLSELARVLEEKCSDRLPPAQCSMQFMNCSLWLAVGVNKKAPPILICNGLGFVLSVVQLSLIGLFPSSGSRKKAQELP